MKTNMEMEIFSQGEVVRAVKEKYIKNNKIELGIDFDFKEIKFIASGSSYNVGRIAHKLFEAYTEKNASFEYASEFISNPNRKIDKDTLYCFITQSGETFDTKTALQIVKNGGGKTLAIVNNSDSTVYNLCDYKVDVIAGVEKSIAATKSFISCIVCLWLVALSYAKDVDVVAEIDEAICAINDVLADTKGVDVAAEILCKKEKISLIGYDFAYCLAKEGALKIKETSYIDTTAYPTGEFLHGHTAILNKSKSLIEIFFTPVSQFEANTLAKIEKDFSPEVVAITDMDVQKAAVIKFKKYNYLISKICAVVVNLQLLALKIATNNGANVDSPDGLSKVVSG